MPQRRGGDGGGTSDGATRPPSDYRGRDGGRDQTPRAGASSGSAVSALRSRPVPTSYASAFHPPYISLNSMSGQFVTYIVRSARRRDIRLRPTATSTRASSDMKTIGATIAILPTHHQGTSLTVVGANE